MHGWRIVEGLPRLQRVSTKKDGCRSSDNQGSIHTTAHFTFYWNDNSLRPCLPNTLQLTIELIQILTQPQLCSSAYYRLLDLLQQSSPKIQYLLATYPSHPFTPLWLMPTSTGMRKNNLLMPTSISMSKNNLRQYSKKTSTTMRFMDFVQHFALIPSEVPRK